MVLKPRSRRAIPTPSSYLPRFGLQFRSDEVLSVSRRARGQIAPNAFVGYSHEMRWVASLLIVITLTCPVMCCEDFERCSQNGDSPSRTQCDACCSHCLQDRNTSEEDIPLQPARQCACSCLCSGAVKVESVSLPELAVIWFALTMWVPISPESPRTWSVQENAYEHDQCSVAGYALRIEECSLRC